MIDIVLDRLQKRICIETTLKLLDCLMISILSSYTFR